MAAADQFCLDCQQLRHHPLLRRCAPHGEGSILPALSAIMREPQKNEGLRLTFTTLRPVLCGEPPKLDHSCLLGMQFQTELHEAFPKVFQKSLRFHPVFEAHYKIISVPDDDDTAPSHLLAPDFDPKVGHVMQVDVRQQWRDYAPYTKGNFCLLKSPILRFEMGPRE